MRVGRMLNQAEVNKIVAQLKADPAVQSVEVDRMIRPTATVQPNAWWDFNDPYIAEQWNLYNEIGGMRADVAWDTSKGDGVVVADLDTGIVPHPDLDANVLPGYDSSATPSFRAVPPTIARPVRSISATTPTATSPRPTTAARTPVRGTAAGTAATPPAPSAR